MQEKISSLRNHCCFKTVRILCDLSVVFNAKVDSRKPPLLSTPAWLAQMEKRRSAELEVAVSNTGRTNTQGLKELGRKFCLCNNIWKWLDLLVFSDKNKKSHAPSNSPCTYNKFCCERNHTLLVKSKAPSPLYDGLLKFTFIITNLIVNCVTNRDTNKKSG